MPYVDLSTIHSPAVGTAPPATWGTQIDQNFDFLSSPPSCRVHNNAAQPIPNSALTILNFQSERFDLTGMHSTVTNVSRLTIATSGKYLIGGHAEFAHNPGGTKRTILVWRNGTTSVAEQSGTPANAVFGSRLGVVTLLNLIAGDFVELGAFQDSGGALDILDLDGVSAEFWATWLAN